METNAKKCGVMVFGSSTLHEVAKGENWPLGGDLVPVTDGYKYLGIWVTPTLSLAAVVAKNAEKGARICAILNPILRNIMVPIYTKTLILKAIILPILTYGAELLGHDRKVPKLARVDADHSGKQSFQMLLGPIKKVYRKVIGTLVQGSSRRTHCMLTVCRDLNLPSIEAICTSSKFRALQKYPNLNTWVSDLSSSKGGRQRTWVNCSANTLNRLVKKCQGKGVPDKRAIQTMTDAELIAKSSAYSNRRYSRWNLEKTSDYVQNHQARPELAHGMHWILRLRSDSVWSAKRAPGAGLIPKEYARKCPSCMTCVADTPRHILVKCKAFSGERTKLIERMCRSTRWRAAYTSCASQKAKLKLLLGGVSEEGLAKVWVKRIVKAVSRFACLVLPKHLAQVWRLKIQPAQHR